MSEEADVRDGTPTAALPPPPEGEEAGSTVTPAVGIEQVAKANPDEAADRWSMPPATPVVDHSHAWSFDDAPRTPVAIASSPATSPSDPPDVWSLREPRTEMARAAGLERGASDLDAPTSQGDPESDASAPIPLDSFALGVDALDALLVLSLLDRSIHGAWVRKDAGLSAEDMAPTLREAYRASHKAARQVAIFSAPRGERARTFEPVVTIEMPAQTALLRRVRSFVVACLFDASLPLGMARLSAARLATALEPELPLADLTRLTLPPPGGGSRASRPPPSLRFSIARKVPQASAAEVEHARRIIVYAESQLPDPHTVRLRLSLRSHTPRLALDHPETLASDAILRLETAVMEMLGKDREQLGLALLEVPS